MSFNINNFKSNIDSYGYIKNNKFEVYIQPPRFLRNKSLNINNRRRSVRSITEILRYRIEQVRTPSVSLLSNDTNIFGIGPTQKMPFNAQFFDTTFSVLLDRNTDLWDFWYSWTNAIFNFNGLEPDGNNAFIGGRIPTYCVEYKDEYSTNMTIVIYDDTGRTVKTINLYEAFPSSIREVQLAWNDNVNLMRLAITVTYSNYSIVGQNTSLTTQPLTGTGTDPQRDETFVLNRPQTDGIGPYFSPGVTIPVISPVVITKEF